MRNSPIRLFDSHCHLYDKKYSPDREIIIRELFDNNIDFVMVPGEDIETSKNIIELSKTNSGIYCAAGQHPHNALKFESSMLDLFEGMLSLPKVMAIGEIGLDFHYDFSPREIQIRVFEEFIKLGVKTKKPIIIHNRKSDAEVLSVLKDTGLNGVIHCFDSNIESAKKFLDLGFMISFSGLITFSKAGEITEVVKYVPLERLMIETDGPYLAPVPFRGKRNEPKYVVYVAQKIAEIKNLEIEEVAVQTKINACKCFRVA